MTDHFLLGGAIALLGLLVGQLFAIGAISVSDALRERRARRIVASYPPTGGIPEGGYDDAYDVSYL